MHVDFQADPDTITSQHTQPYIVHVYLVPDVCIMCTDIFVGVCVYLYCWEICVYYVYWYSLWKQMSSSEDNKELIWI